VSDFETVEHLRRDLLQAIRDYREQTRRGVVVDFDRATFSPQTTLCRLGGGSFGNARAPPTRLGGAYPIAVVVDDFIERLFVNDTLNANPAVNEARRRVPKQGLKFHVATLVCQVTGGPCRYVGRDMKAAHAHLSITEREWQVMLAEFRMTLDKFAVPAAEQGELVAIVNSTKPDIVVGAKAPPR
jgi:hemoglobin